MIIPILHLLLVDFNLSNVSLFFCSSSLSSSMRNRLYSNTQTSTGKFTKNQNSPSPPPPPPPLLILLEIKI